MFNSCINPGPIVAKVSLVRMESGSRMERRLRPSRQQSKTSKLQADIKFPWFRTPLVVQEIILKELAGSYDGISKEDGHRRAACATVCSEWQAFFERRSFRKLVLHASDLSEFAKIVKRRAGGEKCKKSGPNRRQSVAGATSSTVSCMPQIQHIWLRIELLRYQCPGCRRAPAPAEVVR